TPSAQTPTPEAPQVEARVEQPERFLTLGSMDPNSPYRMVATLTNSGAAVVCVEMNEPRLVSMSDDAKFKGGYIGFLNVDSERHFSPEETFLSGDYEGSDRSGGCVVHILAPGTPAEKAGLRIGDKILKIDEEEVLSPQDLRAKISRRRPGKESTLSVEREGKILTLPITLAREPVQVIRPENGDQDSFLTTFSSFGSQKLHEPSREMGDMIGKTDDERLREYLGMELNGFDLRTANWEIESQSVDSVVFLLKIPHFGLEVRKTYTLAAAQKKDRDDPTAKAYHLTLRISVRNVGSLDRSFALQQDGPAGLLTEGHWFCSKVSRSMFGFQGVRDIIVGYADSSTPEYTTCSSVAQGLWGLYTQTEKRPIRYIGVDAQYFSAILIPADNADGVDSVNGADNPDSSKGKLQIKEATALRLGNVPETWEILTNTSCRLRSNETMLSPGESASQEFTIFVGPKRPALLSSYELDNVVYYGWFSSIAVLLTWILHVFYGIVGNYGIAILLLTVLVRLLMFPLSRKQVKGMLIMQKLQPEMKKITEKYEDPMERQRAQMELFRKHNYNPMSGCWVMLIQLPIFIALYRALLVDVELRQAPLFSDAIRFCSNLAAPDMLFSWKGYVWDFISSGHGFFGLGPYFNLLPVLTIIIFIAQQKLFMPPPVDDQQKMQQSIMKYMMIFMGFMFFKVPSGLCLYFIISSLWGLAERQLMPKAENFELEPGVIEGRFSSNTTPSAPPKETFGQKIARLAGRETSPPESPQARNKRRKNKK
ncbi:MAG: YidC/Oxa1 family insertase periplasmic-domain containing protein, partial [Planctomycetia bacterium]|nr:YidC/Oxa1 family insertase periplasmic-domain containing protein [Planctomycetia bacterium]